MFHRAGLGKDRPRCTYCGAAMSRKIGPPGSPPQMRGGELTYPFTQDHIVPRARGGRDVSKNLTPCCGPCNGLKANMPLVEFIVMLGPRAKLTAEQARQLQADAQEACGIVSDATPPAYRLTCPTPRLCADDGCRRQPPCIGGTTDG
jgi:hypothetical protein